MSAIPEAMQRERYADECRAKGVLKQYEALLAAGNPPGFAAMLALKSPPGTRNTDRAFCQGQVNKMERMPKKNRDAIIAAANRAGIRTDGKYYMSGLGKYDNPAAWVSSAQDVIESCKAQNKLVEGVVNFTPKTLRPSDKPKPEPALAPHLVREMEQKYFKDDPGLKEKCLKNKKARQSLREHIVAKHGRPERKKGKAKLVG